MSTMVGGCRRSGRGNGGCVAAAAAQLCAGSRRRRAAVQDARAYRVHTPCCAAVPSAPHPPTPFSTVPCRPRARRALPPLAAAVCVGRRRLQDQGVELQAAQVSDSSQGSAPPLQGRRSEGAVVRVLTPLCVEACPRQQPIPLPLSPFCCAPQVPVYAAGPPGLHPHRAVPPRVPLVGGWGAPGMDGMGGT